MDQSQQAAPAAPPTTALIGESVARGKPYRRLSQAELLANRIARAVRRRTSGMIQELKVEIHRDSVVLEGRCATFYTRQLAQQAAMALADRLTLTDRIQVG